MRPEYRLRFGSLTKPITASAVLAAVEQGKLSLDTRVSDLIPGCPASWGDVTVTTIAYDDVYAVVPNRVRGYAWDDSLGLRNIDYDDHAAYAAGGLVGTATDLFRWSRGVLTGRVFGPELLRRSLEPVRGNYGYGWQIREFFGRRVYNHTGGIDGFSSHLAFYPDDGLTIIVLANVENDSAVLRACDLANLIFGWNPEVDPAGSGRTPGQRCGLEPR